MANDIDLVIGAQDKASAVINAVAGKVSSFIPSLAALGPAAIGVGTALAGAAASMATFGAAFSAVSDAAAAIDSLGHSARGLGESTGDLRAFQFAMEEAGQVSPEGTIAALQKVQKLVGEIASGQNKGGADVFAKLGIDAETLSMQGPIDQLMAVKNAIGGIENATERATVAQKLLGKSAADLIPAMIASNDEFADSLATAEALGLKIDEVASQSISGMMGEIGRTQAGLEGLATEVAASLAPAVEAIALALNQWLPPTIELASVYMPMIVDSAVLAAGYAKDFATALYQASTFDVVGSFETLSNMDTGEQWLASVNEARAAAAQAAQDQLAKNEANRAAAMSAAMAIEEAEVKQTNAAESTIAALERKLAVMQQGEEAVKRQEELATATTDAERERIAVLQQQVALMDEQKRISEEQAKADAARQKEMQRQNAEKLKETESILQGFANAGTGTQATESRLLTRGRSDQGLKKVEAMTEKSANFLEQIRDSLLETNRTSVELEVVGA